MAPKKLSPTVAITQDHWDEVRRGMALLERQDVMVGIPAENAGRATEEDKGPITNAEIGWVMETGSPEQNIPARPHLVPGVRAGAESIVKYLRNAAERALDGKTELMMRALHAAGLAGASAVKNKITDGPFEPLAPRTLAERRKRGRTGIKPLIDTGQYRNAISYVVRDRKED